MTNSSILNAFERFWEHVTTALGKKADIDHTHNIKIPRNLLDNSDFTNPVNQRGQTLYSILNNGMTIDRWSVSSSSPVAVSVIVNANGLTVNFNGSPNPTAHMRQRLPKGILSLDKKYTLAAYYAGEGVRIGTLETQGWGSDPFFYTDSSAFDQVAFSIKENETVVWAALYEGEYTAETLPEYQPKGYGVELVECRRYYQRYEHFVIDCISDESKKAEAFFYLPTQMRIIPTITFSTTSSGSVYNGTIVSSNGTLLGIYVPNNNYPSKDYVSFSYNGQNRGYIVEFKADLLELSAELL